MKKTLLLLLSVIFLSITSCNSDNDLPQIPAFIPNQICYGLDGTINLENAFFNNPVAGANNTFQTLVITTSTGITSDMGALDGSGFITSFNFTGNQDFAIQSGVYTIANTNNVGDVTVTFDPDYDSSSTTNTTLNIESGQVRVTPYRTGFLIEVRGTDEEGNLFHGNYLGNLTPLQ